MKIPSPRQRPFVWFWVITLTLLTIMSPLIGGMFGVALGSILLMRAAAKRTTIGGRQLWVRS